MRLATLLAGFCASLPQTQAALHVTFAKQHQHVGGGGGGGGGVVHDRDHAQRRNLNAQLGYADVTYVVNATVGTPGQPVSLILSSSTSDTWVVDARSVWCTYSASSDGYYYDDEDDDAYNSTSSASDTAEPEYCKWGTFTPANSTSFHPLDSSDDDDDDDDSSAYDYDFSDTYSDGSYAYGSYMAEVLTLAGASVSNLTVGLANHSSLFHGVLGLGHNDSTHDSLPDRLLAQGLINSTAYSLWVDDEQATSGNVLFGAIDTSKFQGNLTRVESQYYSQMVVEIHSINMSSSSGEAIVLAFSDSAEEEEESSSSSYTGTSYPYLTAYTPPDSVSNLPTDIAEQIWDEAGAYYHEDMGLAVIACSAQLNASTTLHIGLSDNEGGPVLTASMADLIISVQDYNLTEVWAYSYYLDEDDDGGKDLCLFGVQNGSYAGTAEYNLGNTLLRRTYSVLDLANYEIAVAPVQFATDATTTTTDSSNIVSFATYGAVVPYASMYCSSYSCTNQTSEDADEDPEQGTERLSGVLSLGGILGLAFGLGLGLLALGLAGFLFWRHRNRHPLEKTTTAGDKEAAGSVSRRDADGAGGQTAAAAAAAAVPAMSMSGAAGTAAEERPPAERSVDAAPSDARVDDVQAGPSSSRH